MILGQTSHPFFFTKDQKQNSLKTVEYSELSMKLNMTGLKFCPFVKDIFSQNRCALN